MVKTMVSRRFFPINPYESQSVVDHSRKFPTMWAPPVISWLITPHDYSYI